MKRKWLAVGIILLFVGTCIIPAIAQNTEKPLLTSRGWLYVGGSGPGNHTKIQDAINDSKEGDTIFVYSGTYYENLVIDKTGLSLVGENRNTTIIDGNKRGNVILLLENSIYIKEFTVQNSSDDRVGIAVQILLYPPRNIENIHISNCIVRNNNRGILFNNVTNCSLINCHLYNLKSQSVTIRLLSENISINNCTINNNGEEVGGWTHSGFIYIDGENYYNCSNITICYNDINNIIGGGISIHKSKNVHIFYNSIYENTHDGISIGLSKNCDIHHNHIFWNAINGIVIAKSNVKIFDNHIDHNGISGGFNGGIHLQDCSKSVLISGNTIESNDRYGLYLLRSSANMITNNNFIRNKYNAHFSHFSLFTHWKGNYWTDWRGFGPKLIKGKLGEVFLPWVNFDWHPAQEPYDNPGMP
jgi:nitrous oxidase accessory protein